MQSQIKFFFRLDSDPQPQAGVENFKILLTSLMHPPPNKVRVPHHHNNQSIHM